MYLAKGISIINDELNKQCLSMMQIVTISNSTKFMLISSKIVGDDLLWVDNDCHLDIPIGTSRTFVANRKELEKKGLLEGKYALDPITRRYHWVGKPTELLFGMMTSKKGDVRKAFYEGKETLNWTIVEKPNPSKSIKNASTAGRFKSKNNPLPSHGKEPLPSHGKGALTVPRLNTVNKTVNRKREEEEEKIASLPALEVGAQLNEEEKIDPMGKDAGEEACQAAAQYKDPTPKEDPEQDHNNPLFCPQGASNEVSHTLSRGSPSACHHVEIKATTDDVFPISTGLYVPLHSAASMDMLMELSAMARETVKQEVSW